MLKSCGKTVLKRRLKLSKSGSSSKKVGDIILFIENKNYGHIVDIESHTQDGRIAGPTNGKIFDYRKMVKLVKSLGRPLTEEEAERYRIK